MKTYDELLKYLSDTCIVHLAVQRKKKYWHHFIISDFGYEERKRIEYDLTSRNFFTGPGQVVEDDLTSDEDMKEAIRKKSCTSLRHQVIPKQRKK